LAAYVYGLRVVRASQLAPRSWPDDLITLQNWWSGAGSNRRAREGEDLTRDKSDPKDAVIIARLAAGLHCYEPERADAVWAAAAAPGNAP
jgi:hypothetical protein